MLYQMIVCDSLISKYCINVETGRNFGFWGNALKTSGFSIKDGLEECFNTWSNTNVHSMVSVRYILVILKCEIEFTREPDINNMYRQVDKFPAYIHVTVYAHIFQQI